MRRIVYIFLLFLFSYFCFTQISFAENSTKVFLNCNEAKGYIQKKEGNLDVCYNKEKNLYIFWGNNFSIGSAENRCGHHCDLDGRNCQVGVCNVLDCPHEKGYTELKPGEGYLWSYFRCYNPKTKISYEESDSGVTSFYLNGNECGRGCDYEGKNCKSGFCNAGDCAVDKGYTQIKDDFVCYNPQTELAYNKLNNYFYYKDVSCGRNCDYEGRNCQHGICNALDCPVDNGYIEFQKSDNNNSLRCYNPKTKISFEDKKFYLNGKECGYNCDLNGQNCQKGLCSVNDCPVKEGYTQIVDDLCYNSKINLYLKPAKKDYHYEIFYLNGKECGFNCDYEGKNCDDGLCNVNECAINKGYTQIKDKKCYNPNSETSYAIQKGKRTDAFYLKGEHCGNNCDIDGKNCGWGVCNVEECENNKGFTEIKKGRCYNPKTKLSYLKEKGSYQEFYLDGIRCGYGCDLDGKNCKSGVCNIENNLKGYTEFKVHKKYNILMSYNPITKLAYRDNDFYIFDFKCGIGCDENGKNCQKGICNVEDCPKLDGYTQMDDKGKCYNPKTGLSFGLDRYHNLRRLDSSYYKHKGYNFYKNGQYIGKGCNLSGRNCTLYLYYPSETIKRFAPLLLVYIISGIIYATPLVCYLLIFILLMILYIIAQGVLPYISIHLIITAISNILKNILVYKKLNKILFSIICGLIMFPSLIFFVNELNDIMTKYYFTPMNWSIILVCTVIVWILFIVILFIAKKVKQARKNK